MSQQITNFFTSIDLTETTPPCTPQPNSPHTPSRRSPRNHDKKKTIIYQNKKEKIKILIV